MHKHKRISVFISLSIFLVFTGCATGFPVRAPKNLAENNPMQKIAILAVATVDWPTHFFKERRLGMTASKHSLEHLLAHNKEELLGKGYDIVLALPVGIGYYPQSELTDMDNNPIERVIFDNYLEEGDKSKIERTTQTNPPVYAYANDDQSQLISDAARSIFKLYEQQIEGKQKRAVHKNAYYMYSQYLTLDFTPLKNELGIIAQETGADTVCLLHIVGKQYTQARKDTTAALGVLFGNGKGVNDRLSTLTSCISTKTYETLWQFGMPPVFAMNENPSNPSKEFTRFMLSYFPNAGSPISNSCKAKKSSLFICQKPTE